MKKIKLFVAAAMLAVSATASAQFTNAAKSGSASAVNTDGWGTFYLQWNPSSINVDVKNADDQSFTGFSVGYNHAFNIVKTTPLFLEVGAGLQYSFYTVDNDNENAPEVKVNFFSAKVPVSLMYKFDIPNSNVSLVPFAGVDFRFNISGKQKTESDDEGYDDDYDDYRSGYGDYDYDDDDYPTGGSDKKDLDLFDKKDMGSKDATWKRFQVGWHIGLNAHLGSNFLLGVSYGSDFSELLKKSKISTTSITLGYRF